MKASILLSSLLILLLSSCNSGASLKKVPASKPNILLIIVDDLRPELNCYGAEYIHSPNIDALARESVMFTRAYTQQAVCAPSRNTLLTGLRPDELGITDLSTFFRTKKPNVITLPQYFMQNGYQSEGMGKVYHTGHGNQDDSLSWSLPHWTPKHIINKRKPITSGDTVDLQTCYPTIDGRKLPWLKSTLPEHFHDDAMVASHAMERLEALRDTSFFLAVGLVKPHLPFVAPSPYWDLYDVSQITVPPPDKPDIYPPYSFANFGELRKYHGMPAQGLLSEEDARNMIHGYYACVSFIDAQVGRIIGRLKELGLYDNTIILLWGDHGWKLGEYGEWCKHTNYELDTRIPLIIMDPRERNLAGWKSGAIVETCDIYPTLCELAGLDLPEHLQGSSFAGALRDKAMDWEDVAFSQYPRTAQIGGKPIKAMGYTMRTKDYRFTVWVNTKTREVLDTEIYDHRSDIPEMYNLAASKEYDELKGTLFKRFEEEYEKEHGRGLLRVNDLLGLKRNNGIPIMKILQKI